MDQDRSGDQSSCFQCEPADPTLPGIRMLDPEGEVEYRNGWAIIGTLVDTGDLIDTIPRIELSASQAERLLAAAAGVWAFGRPYLEGWMQTGKEWVVDVKMRHPALSGRRRDRARAILAAEGVSPLVCAGLRVPSGR